MDVLQQLLGSRLEGVWRDKMVDGQWDGHLVGYHCQDADLSQIDQVRALIEAANTPMPYEEAAQELGKLAAVTVSGKSEQDTEAWATVLLDDLAEFPAHAIREACGYLRRNSNFLPTEKELFGECEYRARTRRALKRISFE